MEALTPKEVEKLHSELVSSELIEIINSFLIERYSSEDSISITIDEVLYKILTRYSGAEKIRREKNFKTNKEYEYAISFYKDKGWSVSINNDVLWFFNK